MALLNAERHASSAIARLGAAATYQASYGAGAIAAIAVMVIDTPSAQAVGQSGFVEIRHEIHLPRIAPVNPARGDVIELNDETFVIQQAEVDGAFWRLIVRKGGD
jgi:hypothetical protein